MRRFHGAGLMRILVIEDDASVLDYISRGLRESGFTVDQAADGKDGLFRASAEKYDALVVDRMLPGVDGLTIIRTLRGADNDTPALILSALGEVDDRVKGLKAGGDDYLVKPFAFAELLARIEALLRRKESSSAVTRLRVADLADEARRAGGDAHHAARERVGLPFRPADQRDRRAHQPAAPEAGQGVRQAAAEDGARRGIHAG